MRDDATKTTNGRDLPRGTRPTTKTSKGYHGPDMWRNKSPDIDTNRCSMCSKTRNKLKYCNISPSKQEHLCKSSRVPRVPVRVPPWRLAAKGGRQL